MKAITLSLLAVVCALPGLAADVSRIIPGTNVTTAGTQIQKNDTEPAMTRAARGATKTRAAVSRRTVSRGVASGTDGSRTSNRAVAARSAATATDGRGGLAVTRKSGLSSRVESASINANPAVRRAGLTLRPSVAEVGGRAKLASGEQTGSNISSEIRNLQSRAATQNPDAAAIAAARERMEQANEVNRSCQEQYNDCMDQFCAVIDTNQKRCSCSANLSKYTKVESAVKEANTKLNEVAQNIRYVGLSADEISAIMSATEAEEAMSGKRDTTESRSMLAEIEKMIKDPTTSSSYSSGSDSSSLLDMDLDFSASDVSDIFSLDFLGDGGTNSIAKLRGASLYNAAKKRCNTIISQCKDMGATADQITGNYDLAIDKDCIAYESGLNKMNETLVSNVRSATRMLQKARLAVLENQNSYDARGCVAALETCMKDEMVCGENYGKCIDPTKTFIDENGNVVLGSNISSIYAYMENYNNARINKDFLSQAYATSISDANCRADSETEGGANDGRCVVKYLLSKIGTKAKATAEGLCRPVLDKCRAYTYDANGTYLPYNDIVVNYIQRAMVNIKSAQYSIVSDYALSCLSDVASCYNDQAAQVNLWSSAASASSVHNIMRGACRNVALTCAYAVFANDSSSCSNETNCINNISEVFYQSLLCPDNAEYATDGQSHTVSANNVYQGWVNSVCKCREGFVTFNGSCLPQCPGGQYLSTGVCSKTACPANSSEVDSSNAEFWDHCRCNTSGSTQYHFDGISACRTCPTASTEPVATQGADGANVLNGWCKCKAGESSYPYIPNTDGLSCIQCKAKNIVNGTWDGTYIAVYNQDMTACDCTSVGANYKYFPSSKCCALREADCNQSSAPGGGSSSGGISAK